MWFLPVESHDISDVIRPPSCFHTVVKNSFSHFLLRHQFCPRGVPQIPPPDALGPVTLTGADNPENLRTSPPSVRVHSGGARLSVTDDVVYLGLVV